MFLGDNLISQSVEEVVEDASTPLTSGCSGLSKKGMNDSIPFSLFLEFIYLPSLIVSVFAMSLESFSSYFIALVEGTSAWINAKNF